MVFRSFVTDGEMYSKEYVKQAMSCIMAQKEEILTAFIAKYKCQPDEVIQITTTTEKGIEWRVELKNR